MTIIFFLYLLMPGNIQLKNQNLIPISTKYNSWALNKGWVLIDFCQING